jgi:hypothetical protein
MGDLPALVLGEVLATPHRRNAPVTNHLQRKPRTWTDTLLRTKQRKNDTRFRAWKVSSLYRADLLTAVASKI